MSTKWLLIPKNPWDSCSQVKQTLLLVRASSQQSATGKTKAKPPPLLCFKAEKRCWDILISVERWGQGKNQLLAPQGGVMGDCLWFRFLSLEISSWWFEWVLNLHESLGFKVLMSHGWIFYCCRRSHPVKEWRGLMSYLGVAQCCWSEQEWN